MLEISVDQRVATVTLSRPPVNAINKAWIDTFHRVLDGLSSRADWCVLVIRSSQHVFCAGADLAQIRGRFAEATGAEAIRDDTEQFQRLFARIEALAQVTIAEIGGAALGGGLELALACDLRIAARDASLGLPEARLGLIPGAGGTQRLTSLAGRGVASRLILCGEIIDGASAAALGIVQWAEDVAVLRQRSAEIAASISRLAPAALAASKACIAAFGDQRRDGYSEELDATKALFGHADTRERITAFLAARGK